MRIQYSVILKENEKNVDGFMCVMIQNKKSPECDQGIIVSFGNTLSLYDYKTTSYSNSLHGVIIFLKIVFKGLI